MNEEINALEAAIIEEIAEAVRDLTTQDFPKIFSLLDGDNGKVTVAFSCEIDRTGRQPKVKTRISFAERHKNEREVYVKDPRQTELDMGEE